MVKFQLIMEGSARFLKQIKSSGVIWVFVGRI